MFWFNKNLSFGYIKSEHSNLELSKKNLFIEIEKIKYQAEVLLKPLKQTDFKKIWLKILIFVFKHDYCFNYPWKKIMIIIH